MKVNPYQFLFSYPNNCFFLYNFNFAEIYYLRKWLCLFYPKTATSLSYEMPSESYDGELKSDNSMLVA